MNISCFFNVFSSSSSFSFFGQDDIHAIAVVTGKGLVKHNVLFHF